MRQLYTATLFFNIPVVCLSPFYYYIIIYYMRLAMSSIGSNVVLVWFPLYHKSCHIVGIAFDNKINNNFIDTEHIFETTKSSESNDFAIIM